MNNKRGKIFVITGPSGAGKTEIAKRLLKNRSLSLKKVITCTTRPPRTGEKDKRDYFFLTRTEFLNNIRNRKMFEYAEVYSNYYGSRKKDVELLLKKGNNVLFVIDVQGALTLKKANKDCIVIFIKAESTAELKKRLTSRSADSKEIILKRVKVALSEMKLANRFDYAIINRHGRINDAVRDVVRIIKSSKNLKTSNTLI